MYLIHFLMQFSVIYITCVSWSSGGTRQIYLHKKTRRQLLIHAVTLAVVLCSCTSKYIHLFVNAVTYSQHIRSWTVLSNGKLVLLSSSIKSVNLSWKIGVSKAIIKQSQLLSYWHFGIYHKLLELWNMQNDKLIHVTKIYPYHKD